MLWSHSEFKMLVGPSCQNNCSVIFQYLILFQEHTWHTLIVLCVTRLSDNQEFRATSGIRNYLVQLVRHRIVLEKLLFELIFVQIGWRCVFVKHIALTDGWLEHVVVQVTAFKIGDVICNITMWTSKLKCLCLALALEVRHITLRHEACMQFYQVIVFLRKF